MTVIPAALHRGSSTLLMLVATAAFGMAQESQPTTRPNSRPTSVDLRPRFEKRGLSPRHQGARPTCSVFTVVSTLEFALAEATGKPMRLSPEFANRAKNLARGFEHDGGFFHDILEGLARFGAVAEKSFPYAKTFDPKAKPAIPEENLTQEAIAVKALVEKHLRLEWIKPWSAKERGLDDSQFSKVKEVLSNGLAVGTGMAHSRTLVGYRDDPSKKGGGVFLTLDSGSGRFDEVTYEFVKTELYDVFYFDIVSRAVAEKTE